MGPVELKLFLLPEPAENHRRACSLNAKRLRPGSDMTSSSSTARCGHQSTPRCKCVSPNCAKSKIEPGSSKVGRYRCVSCRPVFCRQRERRAGRIQHQAWTRGSGTRWKHLRNCPKRWRDKRVWRPSVASSVKFQVIQSRRFAFP